MACVNQMCFCALKKKKNKIKNKKPRAVRLEAARFGQVPHAIASQQQSVSVLVSGGLTLRHWKAHTGLRNGTDWCPQWRFPRQSTSLFPVYCILIFMKFNVSYLNHSEYGCVQRSAQQSTQTWLGGPKSTNTTCLCGPDPSSPST